MNGDQIYRALLKRGYSPPQAAALTGNILQESGGDPNRLNAKEGANGLLQWRNERWQGLQDYAASRGTSPYDPDTQLDYIGVEMVGPEKRSGTSFMAAPDVESANAALKRYIRYGDNSQGTRLSYARALLNDAPTATAPKSRAETQAVEPMPGAAGTSPPVQNLDQSVAAQRLLDRRAFSASPNAPRPDARYLIRVPSPANSASGAGAPANAAPSIAPASFADRFGNWPPSSQASAPVQRGPAAPDAQPWPDGRNTGFGIYKYPTQNQLELDPGALSASPKAAASPDARYLVRRPSSQTSVPALPYQPGAPQQPSPPPGGTAGPPRPVVALPSPIWGFPNQSKDDTGDGDNWLLRWLGSIGVR